MRGSGSIDEIIVSDDFSQFLNLIGRLRGLHFDLAINLYRLYSFKGALKMFFLFLAIGAKSWVGRDTNKRGFFYHIRVQEELPDNKHEVEHKLDIIRSLGAKIDDVTFDIQFDSRDEDFVARLLKKEGVAESDLLIGVNCATFKPKRNLEPAGYARFVDSLNREIPAKIAFCARDIDRKILSEIKANTSAPVVDLLGRFNTRQLAAFIKRCNLFVSPDSGPMHIAAALKTPLISLFGEGEYEEMRPFAEVDKTKIILTPVKSITPEEVLTAAKQLLW